MKIKYASEPDRGIPIQDSDGLQIVKGILQDGQDVAVIFVDLDTSSLYIEKVKSLGSDMLKSSNFVKIEDDEKWNAYAQFFKQHGCVPEGVRL